MLRTLLDVVLQYQQELGADERTRTADLIPLRVCYRVFYPVLARPVIPPI
jgi:hypothetical protein